MNIEIKFKLFLLLAFLTLFQLNAKAQDYNWTYLFDWGGNNNSDFSFYYDKESIKYKSNYIEVWIYKKYNKYVEYPSHSGSFTQVSHFITKSRIYCDNDKFMDSDQIIYFVNDAWSVLLPYYDDGYYVDNANYNPVPGTQYYKLVRYFCK